MAPYAVHITYRHPWKGLQEEWSNVFHYNLDFLQGQETDWSEMAGRVITEMKKLHGPGVTVVRARIHGPTNAGAAADVMRFVQDYNTPCTGAVGGFIPPELAVIAEVYVGRGPRGGKQFLRKYVHSVYFPSGGGNSDKGGSVQALIASEKAPYIAALNELKTITVNANGTPICTPNGKQLPLGSAWVVKDYTGTRQFRRRGKRRRVV
jgi:hypothetical protein